MSSTMARAARKTLRPLGAWGATNAKMPSAKAMSVAMGIAQPHTSIPAPFTRDAKNAGASMPPIAPAIRQGCMFQGREFARKCLAHDLQPHKEKEDCHQPVV